MFITSSFCSAKPSLKIPETFAVGEWIGAESAKAEKRICKSNQIDNEEEFVISFNSKKNSYMVSAWEAGSKAKVISLSVATPSVLQGKAKFNSYNEGGESTETSTFDFYIKNDRLYSKYFDGRNKKLGLYHCR